MRKIEKVTSQMLRVGAIVVASLWAVACSDIWFDEGVEQNTQPTPNNPTASSVISPACMSEAAPAPAFSQGRLSTRSLINKESTVKLQANFLRIDEDVQYSPENPAEHNRGLYTFHDEDPRYEGSVNWEKSYLLESTIMAASDGSQNSLRSAYLDPVQSYKLRVVTTSDEQGNKLRDTTDFYHTRMVSWYPMNCRVPRTSSGKAANVLFDENYDEVGVPTTYDTDGDGTEERVVAIQFKGLDGTTDVMVSDMREGQHWHRNSGTHRSDFYPDDAAKTGPSIYKEPFGHFEQDGVSYNSNFFTYKHYLSAVRIFAFAEQSAQNLSMWGKLEQVVINNQPTSVKVWLPDEENEWGEAFDWGDYGNIVASCDPIYGEGDTTGDLPERAEYPISMEHTDHSHQAYLGYALVQPDHDVSLQLHTTSGVYTATIPANYVYTLAGKERSDGVFRAGHIYNIHLDLRTTGSIAAILENEANELYYDLTRLHTFDVSDENEGVVDVYKYANCYICSPNHTFVEDADGNQVLDQDGNPTYYDGYCFSATMVGNGEGGIISYGAQTMYPTTARINPQSARLLWESELGLITQVELLYGYVRFKVPDRTKEGNAVIAVYDDQGEVLWSWHIWITDPPQDQVYAGDAGLEIVMLDRNLGATSAKWTTGDPSTALDTYGLYYQWGRKDPSMSPPSHDYYPINLLTKPYWDYSSRVHYAAEVVQVAEPSLRDGVENPMCLILPTAQNAIYSYNWTYDLYDFLWGYSPEDGTMVKTIYDPCPFGYRVPLSEMSTIFAADGLSVFQTPNNNEYGQIFTNNGNTFYFPYAGYKGVDVGLNSLVLAWSYVGEKGDYMSASVSKNTANKYNHRNRVYISRSNSWTETNVGSYNAYRTDDFTNRRTAGSVRCVKNVHIGMLDLNITTNKSSVEVNDEVLIDCEGVSSESNIVTAKLTVTNISTGAQKILYQTPEGTAESNDPKWSRQVAFNTGDEDGEFYSPLGYVFALTCTNNLGVSGTVKTSVFYHSLAIDFDKWEAAELAETTTAGSTITRNVHILSSEAPSKVEVLYTVDGVEKTVDITSTGFASLLPDEGYASNQEYVATFTLAEAGVYDVTVRVTCGLPDAHVRTKDTTVSVFSPVDVELRALRRYLWTSDDEENPFVPVTLQYYAQTDNEDKRPGRPNDLPEIFSQRLYFTDGVVERTYVDIPLDEERVDISVSEGSAVIELDSRSSLNYTVTYEATDVAGAKGSARISVGMLDLDSSLFPSVATLGNESLLQLHLHGGGTPTSVTLDGVPMVLPPDLDHSGSTVFVHDGTWQLSHIFSSTGEKHLPLVVTLKDDEGNDVVLPTRTLSLVVYNALGLNLDVAPRYLWREHIATSSAVAEWQASSPNGALSQVVTTIDGAEVAELTVRGNTADSAERSGSIVAALQSNTDGRAEVEVVATDAVGATGSQESFVAIMDIAYEAGWGTEVSANRTFSRTLTINGGEEPTAVSVGGVAFAKSATNEATDYYSSTNWTGSFSLPEGVYDTYPVEATFANGTVLTYNYAEALNVTKPLDPITVTITATDEIFYGVKSAGSLAAAASSPNGNIEYVKITDRDGDVIFEGNPNSPSWSNESLAVALADNVRGFNQQLTLYARDEYGVEATATTTANLYHVVQQTDNTFVAGGMYLIQNRNYTSSYVYDAGNNLGITSTLSSDALFTFSATGTSQKIMSTNNKHYVRGGTSGYSSISCNSADVNQATTYTVAEYGSNYFRIGYNNRYWYQGYGSTVLHSNGSSNSYQWAIYQALAD